MRESLKATKSFTYAGRALTAGDDFTAVRRDARLLRALRRATPAEDYQTAEARVEVTKAVAEKVEPAKKAPRKAASK